MLEKGSGMGVKFDKTINISTVIAIIVMLVSGIAGYIDMRNNLSASTEALREQIRALKELQLYVYTLDRDGTAHERNSINRLVKDLDEIKMDVKAIRNKQ
jgi:S-adenosylmethionine synthetase